MIELSEFDCHRLLHLLLLFVSKLKVSVSSCCQCTRLPNPATCMAVWVRFSHPYLHLCRPGGSAASRLTRVSNPFGRCGPYLRPVQIQGWDAVSVSSTGIVPVHQRWDWRGLPVSLQTHWCMHSDLPERPVEYVRGIDCASRPMRCKIQEMQAVWWLSPV